jgi:hypothetical protein
MFAITTALFLLAAGSDSDAAFADRQTLPPAVQPYAVYLTTAIVAPEHREQLAQLIAFTAPSLSSKAYLGDQLPVAVAGTNLLRLDLQGLGWETTWPAVVAQHYVPAWRPDLVHTKQGPLVVSGLWFVAALTDSSVTGDAQYQLLYGGKPPKTAKEFQAAWQVNPKPELFFGRIEGQSGVAVQRTRLVENHPTGNRGYSWATFDSRSVAGQNDPLENLTARPPQHDASELIAAIPKHMNGQSGSLQAYFLADGKGNRQEKAPADIVTDDTAIRGVEIRNTLSCIACHVEGIRHPTLDQYRAYITAGARIYAYDKATQQELDRYLDSPIAREINRNNEDYAAGVQLCNGLTPQQNSAGFRQLVQLYDAPLGLEQQARELYATSADEWRLALGNYSRTYQLSGRLALAAQGEKISREQWQANFALAQKILSIWQSQ